MKKQPNSYDCFICGLKNADGVHVAFYEQVNEEGQAEVLARFTGRDPHQGYPGRMHGGVATGILDETMGRAIQIGQNPPGSGIWYVTMELTVRFLQPVPLNVELTARGRVTRDRRRTLPARRRRGCQRQREISQTVAGRGFGCGCGDDGVAGVSGCVRGEI